MLFGVCCSCCNKHDSQVSSDYPMLFHKPTSGFSSAILSGQCVMLDRLVTFFGSFTYSRHSFSSSVLEPVFDSYPWVVAFFAGLWLAILGGSLAFVIYILLPVSVNPASNRSPTWTSVNGTKPFMSVVNVISLMNDTLVFLAIYSASLVYYYSRNAQPSDLFASWHCLLLLTAPNSPSNRVKHVFFFLHILKHGGRSNLYVTTWTK